MSSSWLKRRGYRTFLPWLREGTRRCGEPSPQPPPRRRPALYAGQGALTAWSRSTGGMNHPEPVSRDHDHAGQVAGVEGEAFDAVGADDDGVGVAEAGQAGDVETGLDAEDHVLRDDVIAAFVDEGPFVALESDAVAGVVALQLGDTELGEGVADVAFHLGEPAAGTNGVEGGLLQLHHDVEVLLKVGCRFAEEHRPLQLGAVAADVRPGSGDEDVAAL